MGDDGGLTLEVLRARRADIERVAARRGASNIWILQPAAQGETNGSSDVGLLVEIEPGRTQLDLSELSLDLEEILACRVDVVDTRQPASLAERLRRYAVPL